MFKIGHMHDEISLYRRSVDVDSLGAAIDSEVLVSVFYGKVITGSGREFVQSNQDVSQETISVLTHYRDDVASRDLLEWQFRRYEIVAVVNRQRDDETQINAIWSE